MLCAYHTHTLITSTCNNAQKEVFNCAEQKRKSLDNQGTVIDLRVGSW